MAAEKQVECYCGAMIRRIEFEGVTVWIGTTVNPPYEVSTRCYPEAPGPDSEAHHEPLHGASRGR